MPLAEPDIEARSGKRRLAQFRVAGRFALASIPFFIGGVAGTFVGGHGGLAITIVGCIFGGMMLFVAALIYLFSWRWQKHVDDMAAGDRFVHWRYSREQWTDYIEGERRRNRWAPVVVGGMALIAGLVVAALMADDNSHIAGEPVLTWTLIPGGLFLVGALFGWVIQICIRRGLDRMALEGGEVFIGPQGVYISGSFWPWRTAGQYLTGVKHLPGPPDTIIFTFHIHTGKGSYDRDVHIPVPVGCEDDVPAVLSKIG